MDKEREEYLRLERVAVGRVCRCDKERKELLNQIFQLETELNNLKVTLDTKERMNAGLRATCRFLKFKNERLDEQIKEYRKVIDLDTAVNDLLARIKSV